MKRTSRLFDTNVPIIANFDQSPQATEACQRACIEQITRLFSGLQFVLVLDMSETGSEILSEYRHNLRQNGSGVGDLFLRWVSQHWADEEKCHLVRLTKYNASYAEFPDDDVLKKLDLADHKWIAAAHAHRDQRGDTPIIVQAADVKWKAFEAVLQEHDLSLDFICDRPSSRPPTATRKSKRKPKRK